MTDLSKCMNCGLVANRVVRFNVYDVDYALPFCSVACHDVYAPFDEQGRIIESRLTHIMQHRLRHAIAELTNAVEESNRRIHDAMRRLDIQGY